MKKTLIQGFIGVATPVQAVVASSATDWRDAFKDANLIFAGIVGAVTVYLVVRRAVMHAVRDLVQLRAAMRQGRLVEKRIEQQIEADRERFTRS